MNPHEFFWMMGNLVLEILYRQFSISVDFQKSFNFHVHCVVDSWQIPILLRYFAFISYKFHKVTKLQKKTPSKLFEINIFRHSLNSDDIFKYTNVSLLKGNNCKEYISTSRNF